MQTVWFPALDVRCAGDTALDRGDPPVYRVDGSLVGGASGIDDLIGQTDRRGTRDVPPADEDGVQQGLHHVPECDHDRYDRRFADDVSPDRPSDPRAVGLQHDEHNRIV